MLDPETTERLGDELYTALRSRQPVSPLTERDLGVTLDDVYRTSRRVLARRVGQDGDLAGESILS